MVSGEAVARGVHFTGSVPLEDAETVLRTIASAVGDRLRRVPDGETAHESQILSPGAILANHPDLEPAPPSDHPLLSRVQRYKLRDGADPDQLEFSGLQYANTAKTSFEIFTRLKREGVIPESVRFQVGFATPAATLAPLLDSSALAPVEPAFEAALLAEVAEVVRSLPADDLAIQWDCPTDVAIWKGMSPVKAWWSGDVKAGVLERLTRLGAAVPEEVELGYHLCSHMGVGTDEYPNLSSSLNLPPEIMEQVVKRIGEALRDAGPLAELAGALCESVPRTVDWIHMPAPRDLDDSYFVPYGEHPLPPETELYLGLVYYTDGLEGTRRRIEAAQKVVQEFGIATECGWRPRPPETIPELLEIHREATEPVTVA